MEKVKYVLGGSIAYFIGSIFNAILVVWKETDESIYNWLKNTFGHHWIGHGIITLLVFFIILGLSIAGIREGGSVEEKSGLVNILVIVGTLLSFIIILGFFMME